MIPMQTLSGATAVAIPGKTLSRFSDQLRRKPDGYSEQWLAAIVEFSDDAIMSKDLNSIIATWNRGAENLFGYTAEEVVGRPVTLLTPLEHRNEEPEILERIKRGVPVAAYETVRQHKDGTLIDISLKVSPIKSGSGEVVGASTIIRDVRGSKRAREAQDLLLREMNHRVTNVLAIANGLVALSARTATDPMAMAKAIQERLTAFTRAHELTRSGPAGKNGSESRSSSLRTLIHTIAAPYAGFGQAADQSCIVVDGEDITVGGSAMTGLALVLHEFTTNAAKYGALSSPAGRVRLICARTDGDLSLTWTESGGPRIEGPPKKEGFGSVLARRTVAGQFGGNLSYDWAPRGVVIHLRFPLKRLV